MVGPPPVAEQHGLRLDETKRAGADIDEQHAGDRRAILGRNERDRAMLLQAADAGPRPDLLHQPADDLDPGEIAFVDGAVEGLAGERLAVQRAVGVAVEEAADLVFELGDALDRLGHERPGELLVGQPLAALDRVHEMPLDRVALVNGHVVAALHHARAAAFADEALGRDGNIERRIGGVRMQRGEQAGATRAEDQNIRLEPFQRHADFQNTLARNTNAATAEAAAASSASRFWPSSQPMFSSTSSRSPPSMWIASRNTRIGLGELDDSG